MARASLLALAAALASAALAAVPVPARAAPSGAPVIASDGFWSLARLGYDDLHFRVRPVKRQKRAVRLRYPPGASQGRDAWYVIRLKFEIAFAPDSGSGRAYVSAGTNGWPGAQIAFETQRTPAGLSIVSDALGMIAGSQVKRSTSTVVPVDFANYLPYRAVRPGPADLTVQLEQYDAVKVRSLRVFAQSSGIERSRVGPGEWNLALAARPSAVRPGDRVEVVYSLRNRGERPAGRAAFAVRYPRGALRLDGPAVLERPIGTARDASGSFVFEAQKPGRHVVEVAATVGPSAPAGSVTVTVEEREASGLGFAALATASGLALLLAAGLGYAVVSRTRRGRAAG